jgi:hypothetical protein
MLPSIVRIVKSRRLQWAGYVEDGERKECIQNFDEETPKKISI